MQYYAQRLKAGIELERPIALGVLKIKAKVGELMPAEKGGRGKTSTGTSTGFRRETLAIYRKLATNREKLDEYYAASDDVPSQSDFLKFVANGSIIATKHGSGVVDWYTPAKYIELCRTVMGSIDLDPASGEQITHSPSNMVPAVDLPAGCNSGEPRPQIALGPCLW